MDKAERQAKKASEIEQSGTIRMNRRQFMKMGAVATASGALMSAIGHTDHNKNLPTKIAPSSVSLDIKDNPLRITDRCKRMPQKNTIFSRQLWDFEFVQRIESSIDSSSRDELGKTNGWTQLDDALNEAAWAVDHKFASGSESGVLRRRVADLLNIPEQSG